MEPSQHQQSVAISGEHDASAQSRGQLPGQETGLNRRDKC